MNCTGYSYLGCPLNEVVTHFWFHLIFSALYGVVCVLYGVFWVMKCAQSKIVEGTAMLAVFSFIHCIFFTIYHIMSAVVNNFVITNIFIYTVAHNFMYITIMYFAFMWINMKSRLMKLKVSNGLGVYMTHFIVLNIWHNIAMLVITSVIAWMISQDNFPGYILTIQVYWMAWVVTNLLIFGITLRYGMSLYCMLTKRDSSLVIREGTKIKEIRNILIFIAFLCTGGEAVLALYSIYVPSIDSVTYRYLLTQSFINGMEYIISCYCLSFLSRGITL